MKSHLDWETASLKQERVLQSGSQPMVSMFRNTYSDDEEEDDEEELEEDDEEDEFDEDDEEDGTLIEV